MSPSKRRVLKPFALCAAVLASCCSGLAEPEIHLIPKGYTGNVFIIYAMDGGDQLLAKASSPCTASHRQQSSLLVATSDMGSLKQRIAIGLTCLSSFVSANGLWAFWVLVSTFAAGLIWWASLCLVLAGPLALAGFLLSLVRPRQPGAAWLNGILVIIFATIWYLLFRAGLQRHD